MTKEEMLGDCDWKEAFAYCRNPSNPLTREVLPGAYVMEDVEELLVSADGEPDERDWVGAFRMKDGRYVLLRAGCDYTGWDCRASGSCEWAASAEELKAIATPDERERLWPQEVPTPNT